MIRINSSRLTITGEYGIPVLAEYEFIDASYYTPRVGDVIHLYIGTTLKPFDVIKYATVSFRSGVQHIEVQVKEVKI